MQQNSPGISIQDLTLQYHNEIIFRQLNLDISAKEITCLLGPSGVGKSSLMRFIAGLAEPLSTEISGMIKASDNEPLTHRIAYLAQNDLLFPWLNATENVYIGHSLRGEKITSTLRAQAEQALIQVGLKKDLHKMPTQLSGGMRQRVALARMLFEDRPVVLMDEPFSALDAITRLQLQNLTGKLLANKTVLFITHDPLEALRMGNHIYLLTGRPAQITQPLDLTGSIPRAIENIQVSDWQAKLYRALESSYHLHEESLGES